MSFTLPFYRTSVFVSSLQDLESNKKIINVLIQNQPLVQNLQMIRMINYSKHKKNDKPFMSYGGFPK